MYSMQGTRRSLDQEIALYQARKFKLVDRTAFSAHLQRKPPYKVWLAVLLFLALGIGLLIYTFVHALASRRVDVYITADEYGNVVQVEQRKAKLRPAQWVFVALVPILLVLVVVAIIALGRQADAQRKGVHICNTSNINTTNGFCNFDDGQVAVGRVDVARITVGSTDGHKFTDPSFSISVYKQSPGSAYLLVGRVSLSLLGQAQGMYKALGDVFSADNIPVQPGRYRFSASLQGSTTPDELGSATVQLTP